MFLSHSPITRRADYASRRRGAGRSRRTRSRSGRSGRSTRLEDVRLVNLARQSSSSLSCGKRILSRSGLIAAAGRRREGGEGVERCRCACQVFFMLCMHHLSLRLSLLRCPFFYRDECEVPEQSARHIIFVRLDKLLLHEALTIHRRLGRSLFPCCVEQVRLVRLIVSLLGGESCGTVTQKSG